MGLFDSSDITKAQVEARMAYSKSNRNTQDILSLERRIEKLEEYLSLEWSESNDKYYKITPKRGA